MIGQFQVLVAISAIVLSNQCLAFDEDGFRTGMTVEEVKERLAPKRRLELVFEKFEYYVALPPQPGRPIGDPSFYFCDGKLTTYSYRLTWKQYSELMEKTLARRGQPTEVFIAGDLISLEDDGRVVSHAWISNGERFSLAFSPTATEHVDKEKRAYPAEVGFTTTNECTKGEPPDRNQMLPRIGAVSQGVAPL